MDQEDRIYTSDEISNVENELVKNASKEYGMIYNNVENIIQLHYSCISELKQSAWAFAAFFSQTYKSLSLALLSTVRMHDTQSLLMLRYALESAVLACYSLHDISSIETTLETGIIDDDKIKDKAYKWLEGEYPEFNVKIKNFKKWINANYAHANIDQTDKNFSFTKEKVEIFFFDKSNEFLTRQRLWLISNIAFGIADLYYKVSADYPSVTASKDFLSRMKELGDENSKIKHQLMNDPEFAKLMGKKDTGVDNGQITPSSTRF